MGTFVFSWWYISFVLPLFVDQTDVGDNWVYDHTENCLDLFIREEGIDAAQIMQLRRI